MAALVHNIHISSYFQWEMILNLFLRVVLNSHFYHVQPLAPRHTEQEQTDPISTCSSKPRSITQPTQKYKSSLTSGMCQTIKHQEVDCIFPWRVICFFCLICIGITDLSKANKTFHGGAQQMRNCGGGQESQTWFLSREEEEGEEGWGGGGILPNSALGE